MEEVELDWKKVKQNSEKIGYSDGIEEGRASNFQKSFDEGYKSGFKNGFELGKLKGQYMFQSDINAALKCTKLGNCCICKDPTLMNKANPDKETTQWESTKLLISTIAKPTK